MAEDPCQIKLDRYIISIAWLNRGLLRCEFKSFESDSPVCGICLTNYNTKLPTRLPAPDLSVTCILSLSSKHDPALAWQMRHSL